MSGPLIFDDADLMIRAVLDGLGLTFSFEEYVAPQIATGTLVRVLEEWCAPFAGYFLYHPSRRQQSPAAIRTSTCWSRGRLNVDRTQIPV